MKVEFEITYEKKNDDITLTCKTDTLMKKILILLFSLLDVARCICSNRKTRSY